MTSFTEAKLGDFFRLKHGFAFKSAYFVDRSNLIVVTPGNFYDEGGFKHKGDKEKFYEGPVPEGFMLRRGDLIVAMTEQAEGLLGSPAKIAVDNKYLHNQRLGKVVELDAARLDKSFLYYLFNLPAVRAQIRATANGAKVRHTSPSRIYDVEFKLPPLPTQQRIAAILSAYDDLIENNTRRIAILEEMARRLYEEWFVHFRFPGHKEVEFEGDGDELCPQGWEFGKLSDYVELKYGKALKASDRIEGEVPVYGSSGVVGWHNEPLAEGPGIIVGRKGNVGSVFWSEEPFYPIDTVYFVDTVLPLEYVFFNLQKQNFLNNDAAVPGLNRQQAYSLPFLRPASKLLQQFVEFSKPVFSGKKALERKNANLRDQRNLLLPKLVSGEIDVSEAEEAMEAAE